MNVKQSLFARIREFLDHHISYCPGVAEQCSLAPGEIKRHEFQPPAFFASAGLNFAKPALAQDIQLERLHRVLSSCKFIKKRARRVRKPKKPLGLFRVYSETCTIPQKACYELPTCATYFSLPTSCCHSRKPEDHSIRYRRTICFCVFVIRWLVVNSLDRRSWSAARLSCPAWAVS